MSAGTTKNALNNSQHPLCFACFHVHDRPGLRVRQRVSDEVGKFPEDVEALRNVQNQ